MWRDKWLFYLYVKIYLNVENYGKSQDVYKNGKISLSPLILLIEYKKFLVSKSIDSKFWKFANIYLLALACNIRHYLMKI